MSLEVLNKDLLFNQPASGSPFVGIPQINKTIKDSAQTFRESARRTLILGFVTPDNKFEVKFVEKNAVVPVREQDIAVLKQMYTDRMAEAEVFDYSALSEDERISLYICEDLTAALVSTQKGTPSIDETMKQALLAYFFLLNPSSVISAFAGGYIPEGPSGVKPLRLYTLVNISEVHDVADSATEILRDTTDECDEE